MARIGISIVAPSSRVPRVELELGVARLKELGHAPRLHPQTKRQHLFFAGTDEERAQAFFEAAVDPATSVVWCARGGYGAIRLLPYLDRITAQRGVPERKLLVGYSDATILLEYVRNRWSWATLHGPMIAGPSYLTQSETESAALEGWIRAESSKPAWSGRKLRFLGTKPKQALEGPLVGGNLTVWTALSGTPYAPPPKGKILFFEDVGEQLYRVDRMLQQLVLSGGFKQVRAVVLGEFQGCDDIPPRVLAKAPAARRLEAVLKKPRPADLAPLRPKLDTTKTLTRLFRDVCEPLGIPVAAGLPVGHGHGKAALPLGASYRLGTDGKLQILRWDWLRIS